ncbi:MAG: DUF1648 domain-containing protein [Gammaproteobacteria bacterium]|nr:DUF1648 domain-containing protein [Gammaproteobacteria bacterium]
MMKTGIYISLLAGLLAQYYYLPLLPENVAIHFGRGGYADGWASSQTSLIINTAILVLNSTLFLSVPFIFKNLPIKYISFPRREFWLAPERKAHSIKIISNWLLFMGLATNLFLLVIFHLGFRANQLQPPRLNEDLFINLLSIYFIVLTGWLIFLFRKFNKTDE